MSWNNGYEKAKFIKQQKKQAEEYRKAGMTQEQIDAMYAFDLDNFLIDRWHGEHTQSLNLYTEDLSTEDRNPLLLRFLPSFSSEHGYSPSNRYWWIDEIENPKLCAAVLSLSKSEKDLTTHIVFEGYNCTDAANSIFNVSPQRVSTKWKKIRNKLILNCSNTGGDEK